MLPISLLATMTYDWMFLEPNFLVEGLINAMLVVLLSKLWFWIENHDWHNCFWMSLWLFVGWTLTGPKKASKSTILHNRLNKEKTPGRCCQSRYLLLWSAIECFWNHILVERLMNAMLVVLLSKLWFWIENHGWAQLFLDVFLGLTHPLLDPKKLQNQQFYIIDWIRKKLLVDVANLATCCHDDYDVHWRFWEPCANAMLVVSLVSQPFRQRARALAENDLPTRCIRITRCNESFSANARARWRKGCETKETTNIAFAQGSQNIQ